MNNPPIPINSASNIAGAIGDVLRAGCAWGAESVRGEPHGESYQLCLQMVVQALAVIYQRVPTPEEIEAVFPG